MHGISRKENIIPKDYNWIHNEYVILGKTAIQISNEFGCHACTIKRRLKRHNILNEGNNGHRNPNWKGDNTSYFALHEWIGNHKLKPKFCEECKKVPPLDLANINGTYNRDINNYEWLCRRCHMLKDGRLEKLISVKCKKVKGGREK